MHLHCPSSQAESLQYSPASFQQSEEASRHQQSRQVGRWSGEQAGRHASRQAPHHSTCTQDTTCNIGISDPTVNSVNIRGVAVLKLPNNSAREIWHSHKQQRRKRARSAPAIRKAACTGACVGTAITRSSLPLLPLPLSFLPQRT